MQLLKSLFCLRGFDNRVRFITIKFFCLVSFIVLNEVFVTAIFAAVISLIICLAVSVTTTQRRLNDAQLHRNWILAPTGSFLISGVIVIFIGHGSIYWLLLIPLLLSLLLLTYPSTKKRDYILGYNGPVDLSEYLTKTHSGSSTSQRIEPTMNQMNSAEQPIHLEQNNSATLNTDRTSSALHTHYESSSNNISHGESNDIGESIRLALFSNRNAQITISVVVFLVALAMIISLIFAGENNTPTTESIKIVEKKDTNTELQHHITLPDNFSLMVSTYNGLVISWQADSAENQELWNIGNAQGDSSCQSILFTKGDTIRSYQVNIENNNQYFAYFSPLDTTALVKNIAFKGKFSLCGYEFSLKGSQAVLGKTAFYANLIEY